MTAEGPRGRRSSPRWVRGALTLLVLTSMSTVLTAQDYPVKVGPIEGRIESRWPWSLNVGYFPVFLELENTSAQSRILTVRASRSRELEEIRKSFTLGPRERIRGELVLPGFGIPTINASVVMGTAYTLVLTGQEDSLTIANVGPTGSGGASTRALLVVSQDPLPPGATTVMSRELSWDTLMSTSTTHVNDNVKASGITFAEMPRRSEAYSSLSAVLVKVDTAMPDAATLAPLLAWTRLGGTLILAGPQSEALTKLTPGLREWLEPRFVVDRDVFTRSAVCGLGTIHLLTTDFDIESNSTSAAILGWIRSASGWIPRAGRAIPEPFDPGPPVKPQIPLRPLVACLVGFVVFVGPVNFIRAKRRGKTISLLISIPLLSFLVFAAMIGFGLWHQGLDTQVKSHTLALLDQRTRQSSAIDNRTVYAGWIGGSGLRPGAGTSVFPFPRTVESNLRTFGSPVGPGDAFRLDYDDEIRLTGEFLPPRRTVGQTLLTDRPSRVRLSIERKGPELRVNNGLGAAVKRLWVFDAHGNCYVLTGPDSLESGSTATLTLAANPDPDRVYNRAWRVGGAVPCTYAAVLAENPFGDSCGVKSVEKAGFHYMVGVLDEKEENWK
jgi:hypothetical protein